MISIRTVPLLQGTSLFSAFKFSHKRKIRKSLDREEPFSPSLSNAGLRDSSNMIDKLIKNKSRQCLTAVAVAQLLKKC